MGDYNDNGFFDGAFDLNHDGHLDRFERGVESDFIQRTMDEDGGGVIRRSSGSGLKTFFIILSFIIMMIPGAFLAGLILLYVIWMVTS